MFHLLITLSHCNMGLESTPHVHHCIFDNVRINAYEVALHQILCLVSPILVILLNTIVNNMCSVSVSVKH